MSYHTHVTYKANPKFIYVFQRALTTALDAER